MNHTIETKADFRIQNHGSIFILTGLSEKCRNWIENNVGDENTLTYGQHGIVVDHRYICDIIDGLTENGFSQQRF